MVKSLEEGHIYKRSGNELISSWYVVETCQYFDYFNETKSQLEGLCMTSFWVHDSLNLVSVEEGNI